MHLYFVGLSGYVFGAWGAHWWGILLGLFLIYIAYLIDKRQMTKDFFERIDKIKKCFGRGSNFCDKNENKSGRKFSIYLLDENDNVLNVPDN